MCAPEGGTAPPPGLDDALIVVFSAPVCPAETGVLCRHLESLLADHPVRCIVCDVGGLGRPDLAAVDALARIQLVARRQGHRMQLVHAGPGLRELLVLVGLDEAVALDDC